MKNASFYLVIAAYLMLSTCSNQHLEWREPILWHQGEHNATLSLGESDFLSRCLTLDSIIAARNKGVAFEYEQNEWLDCICNAKSPMIQMDVGALRDTTTSTWYWIDPRGQKSEKYKYELWRDHSLKTLKTQLDSIRVRMDLHNKPYDPGAWYFFNKYDYFESWVSYKIECYNDSIPISGGVIRRKPFYEDFLNESIDIIFGVRE